MKLFLIVCAVIFSGVIVGAEDAPEVEPPHEYSIHVGDTIVPVELNKPFKLNADKNAELTLQEKPDRLFSKAGVSFRFPSYYSFAYASTTLPIWTLNGKNVVVQIQLYKNQDSELILPLVMHALEAQYKSDAKIQDSSLELGALTLKGKVIDPKLASIKMKQQFLTLNVGDDGIIFMIQQLPKKDGSDDPEYTKLIALMKDTFKLTTAK